MALVVKDRVKEVTTTVGTSDFTLGGAVLGYQSFSVIGNTNQTYYSCTDPSTGDWEVGIGTYSTTGPTLTRDTVLESSNSGSKVSFAAGSKDIFCTYPAERSVYLDTAGSAVTVLDVGTLGTSTANITTANITSGTVSTTPTSSTDIANKTYVDNLVASGTSYHTPVKYEVPNTTGNLNALYNNGTGGVGATLTNNGTLVAFAPDGPTASPGDRILVYNQTNAYENGVYTVTTVGSGSVAWVLTRATDADSYGVKDPDALGNGDAFFVTSGNTGAGETYICNTVGTITFGTTAITFAQISAAQVYTAGTGISFSPSTTINIANTGVAATTYGSASQVPVFAVNAQGQLTSVTNTSIAIAAGAVSGLAASATTDTTNASNISSGTLPTGRLTGSYTGITGVGTLTAGTWNANTIGVTYGGTGFSSYTVGDLLYADTSSTLAKLADVAYGSVLLSGGVGTAPSYGKVSLTAHVTGTLAVANGGTGATTLTGYVYGNGTGAMTASTSIPNSATTATSANTASAIVARDASGNFSAGTITASLSGNASTATSAGSVTNSVTFNNGGAGSASGTGFNGSSAITVSYNTIGAPSTTGTNASGTWSINVTGSAGSATTATTATTATNWGSYGAVPAAGTSFGNANTIGRSDANGYTYFYYINSSTSNSENPTVSQVIVTNGSDNFYRKASIAHLTSSLSGTAPINISGNAATASTATSAGYSTYLITQDIRTLSPSSTAAYRLGFGFTSWANNNTSPYADYLALRSYSDASGGNDNLLMFNKGTIGMRLWQQSFGSATAYSSYADVLMTNNYNSYAPTLTGGGASGTWSINITGSAGSAGSVDYNNLTNKTGGTGTYTTSGDYRAPIFYDSNNTGYYVDPASTSLVNNVRAAGTYLRNAAGVGYLDGGYASYETGGTTGPIYTIGGSYYPTSTSLNTMYGIGYANQFTGGLSGAAWGLYVAAGGTVRIYLDADNGIGYASNSFRAPIFYDSNNTGYYVDPASVSYLYGLTLAGGSYFRPNNWIQLDSSYGLYWPNNNGAHFHANASSTYGQLMMQGSRNGWGGIYDSYSAVNGIMYDSSGNGGVYREANGRWYFYYNLSNDCMGIGTSGTSSTYSLYLNKGVYAQSRIDATIFYDTDNTGYYVDPNGTSYCNNFTANSGSFYGATYFYSNLGGYSGSLSSPALQAYATGGNSAFFSWHRSGNYAVNMGLDADNVLRIGGWSASANRFQMDMSGNLTMAGSVTAYSDEKLKKDWAGLSDDFIERLAAVKTGTYTRIDSNERQAGSSAQDWQELLPEVVSEDAAGILSLAYGNAAVVACVELAKSVVALRAEIKALQTK